MKRKYAAMVLGLTLALTSMNMAYAADKDTDTAQTTEAAAEDESADASADTADETASQEVYGEVTEVGEDSITINVGTLKEGQQPGDDQKPEDGEKPEDADADNKDESTADTTDDADSIDESEDEATGDTTDASDKDAKPDGEAPSMLDLTGESQEIKVTDTTTYEKQAAPEKPEAPHLSFRILL